MSGSCGKELWGRVREITGDKKGPLVLTDGITATQLNNHYADLSTDAGYIEPLHKSSCSIDLSNFEYCNEINVFNMLCTLKKTAPGPDEIPYWFLKIAAPSLCTPLCHIFNLSLNNSLMPLQWKRAIISPISKVSVPLSCSDYRPISLTPILARMFEKFVVKQFLYPAIISPECISMYTNQYAFRPTGSTDAAIIAILHHVTVLLQNNRYVRVIALDFSKAFDTVRHNSIATKLAPLPLEDNIYNWFMDYFKDHKHATRFNNSTSEFRYINSSVFQGSAVGPPLFLINGADLTPYSNENYIDKYADDSY